MLNLLYDSAEALQAQLIILDTASDMYDADENVRRHVRRFIRMLRRIAIKLDAAVWLTGHVSRSGTSDDSGQSGSTDWHNNVRNRLYLKTDSDDEDRRILKPMKSNYGPKGAPILLRWRDGVFIHDPAPTGTLGKMQDSGDDEAVLAAIKYMLGRGIFMSSAMTAGNNVVKVLKKKTSPCNDLSSARIQNAFDRLIDLARVTVGAKGKSQHNVEVPK
jgi:RecA-family ATPase